MRHIIKARLGMAVRNGLIASIAVLCLAGSVTDGTSMNLTVYAGTSRSAGLTYVGTDVSSECAPAKQQFDEMYPQVSLATKVPVLPTDGSMKPTSDQFSVAVGVMGSIMDHDTLYSDEELKKHCLREILKARGF